MREEVIAKILEEKIIAIVRGVGAEECMKVAQALYEGGIRLMEITFDQKNPASFQATAGAIRAIGEAYAGKMMVGAGTVTTPELVELAASAGAQYIISPDVNVDVIHRTRELGLVSLPGAMTPTEIVQAAQWGASVVKVFPAGNLGPDYIKAVRGPLDHIPLCAVGGVDHNNLEEFHRAGVTCFGVGSNIVRKELLAAGNYAAIRENAMLYTEQAETW